jgi:hypothetical protein
MTLFTITPNDITLNGGIRKRFNDQEAAYLLAFHRVGRRHTRLMSARALLTVADRLCSFKSIDEGHLRIHKQEIEGRWRISLQ